jgi:nitrile hydratase
VVCTLCSCYPRFLLGIPPDWYKSRSYRSRAVREPRRVLAEFGTEIDAARRIRVHDSTADMRYMILPMRPSGAEGMSEEELAGLVTRDSLIGVTEPRMG